VDARYSRSYRERNPDAGGLYYLANAEHIKAYERRRRLSDPTINARRVAAKHGLTIEERAAILVDPCAICGGVATDVDHDHETGTVRGGLCNGCNSGIGLLRDDPELVARAAQYLASHAPLLRLACVG
jgi:hypothetical protein